MTASEANSVDQDHLERSRRVWDRWSAHYGMSEKDYAPMRETAIGYLGLQPGDAVLDIGCGPGVNLAALRDAVGPDGRVVAVDYSPEMVERARARVDDHGWSNVEVRLDDATSAEFSAAGYDAAIATLSMSVLPAIERATRNVHSALKPGAKFVVFDVRPVPSGPLRALNPLLVRFFRWYANWNVDEDVVAAMRAVFGDVEIVETYYAGMNYTALTEKLTTH